MMNRWGNDEHGPGGDPSWLGGKDRGGPGAVPGSGRDGRSEVGAEGRPGAGAEGSPESGAEGRPGAGAEGRPGAGADGRSEALPGGESGWSSDFSSGSSQQRADQDFGARSSSPAPEHSAPRFGSFGEDSSGGDADRGRRRSDADADSDDGPRMPELKEILTALLPIAVFVVVAIVFFRADFSFWWVAFFIILPTIQRVSRIFGRNRRR